MYPYFVNHRCASKTPSSRSTPQIGPLKPLIKHHAMPSRLVKDNREHLVKDNSSLDGALVLDGVKSLLELLELEGLIDDALRLDLAGV